MSNCQACGHEITNRNRRWFTEFLGKPLCARWRACYKRKTGKKPNSSITYQSRVQLRYGGYARYPGL